MIGISISLIPTSPTDARGRERITKNLIHVYVFSTYEDIDIFWDTHNYVYPRLSDPTKLWSVYICILHEMVNTSGFYFFRDVLCWSLNQNGMEYWYFTWT